ncbi:MAG: hypothetical protein K9N55_02825 [Phycisphaerae bacterium]|nr:hypothetical protein [Phycisphaerae bacterium]
MNSGGTSRDPLAKRPYWPESSSDELLGVVFGVNCDNHNTWKLGFPGFALIADFGLFQYAFTHSADRTKPGSVTGYAVSLQSLSGIPPCVEEAILGASRTREKPVSRGIYLA